MQQQPVCIVPFFLLQSVHDHCREARIVFKPGKNRNGYFDAKELIAQVDCAIDIMEAKTNGLNGCAQGLFLFDNAPSHLKRDADALSARKMVKSVCFFVLFFFINAPPRSEALLDAPSKWASHAQRHQPLDWQITIFLFPR